MKRAKKRIGQHVDESTMEYLRRVVSNLNYEPEGMLDDLKSVDAVLDYYDLFTTYDTDFWEGILSGIAAGDDSAPARAFCRKHRLPWVGSIVRAEKAAREAKANAGGAR